MVDALQTEYFALQRLILVDAYRKGAMTELKLDGHTSLTGANGSGKTSLLRLIPLFYGESPNRLVQGGGVNQSFVQYYLPHTTSFIVFEYRRRGKVSMVVLHASRSGESVYYRFIDQAFTRERFCDAAGALVPGADLNRHLRKRGEFCSEQITALTDYRAIIQNTVSGNREHRVLAANFAFVGPGNRLSHVEKIATGMFSRVTHFRDIKRMIVSCIVDDNTSIRLESSKTTMKDWVREYRAYQAVMQFAQPLQEFQELQLRHAEAGLQLREVHTGLSWWQQRHEGAIERAVTEVDVLQERMQQLEEATNTQLRHLSSQLGEAEGRLRSLQNIVQSVEQQQALYEKEQLPALAALVDALPQLLEDYQSKVQREKALLGEFQELANRYAELRTQRMEVFYAQEREKNALKEPVRLQCQSAENQVRQESEAAWLRVSLEYEAQEEAINRRKEACVELTGRLKQAVEHPQPSAESLTTLDLSRQRLEQLQEELARISGESEEAKRVYQVEKDKFSVIYQQIQELGEQEKQAQALGEQLRLLQEAPPGSLLQFVREFCPGWHRDIARVVPEALLLRTDLQPTLVSAEVRSLYGVGLDLTPLEAQRAGESDQLLQQIQDNARAIERYLRDMKNQEQQLQQQSERLRQAKMAVEAQQRRFIQADQGLSSARSALLNAQRARDDSVRQAGRRAQQELQELQQALEQSREELRHLKEVRSARQQAQHQDLQRRLAAIAAQRQTEIDAIDQALAVAKAAYDQDIGALNQELESTLKTCGVDTLTLEILRKATLEAQEKLQSARSNEIRVSSWRRWLKTEWAERPEKIAQLQAAEAGVQALVQQQSELRQAHEVAYRELRAQREQVQREKSAIEKLHGFIVRRRERLSRWPADPLGASAVPPPDQSALEAEMDRLLTDLQRLEVRAETTVAPVKREFFATPGTLPYQFYDRQRLTIGPEEGRASPFVWLQPLREWFEVEHENVRRLLLSQCRNFSSGVHEFHERLDSFKRKASIFSKDLQDNMAASTRFRFISSVAVRITTSFDTLEGWDTVRQMNEAYGLWAGKAANELPGTAFSDAVDQVSDWLQGRHTLEVKLEDLLGLEIDIEETGQSRKTVKDEGQLKDASSNGLSYLILCVVFVGLINKIRAGQPVQLVWALDELRDLDLDNVRVLLELLEHNHIHLVSAFPDPDPEILALFKNRYAVLEGRRLATFHPEQLTDA